jgi:trans-aconitate 2-methyltransferase
MPWDPEQYHRFQQERFTPFSDLLALIARRPGMRVIDLGCGTGELTRRLANALPDSDVLGIDSSSEMLARAEGQARSGLRFELGSLEDVAGEWDLVFSHAAIHWVDDHHRLVPHLLESVGPGGQLAFQMPANHGHFAHRAIIAVAGEEPFRTALQGWTRESPVLPVGEYAELLYAHGGRDLTAILKVYPHVLPDAGAVAEWTAGTTLVPYFERLPKRLHDPFMERYREMLRVHWPASPVFYGFRRILCAATRRG